MYSRDTGRGNSREGGGGHEEMVYLQEQVRATDRGGVGEFRCGRGGVTGVGGGA